MRSRGGLVSRALALGSLSMSADASSAAQRHEQPAGNEEPAMPASGEYVSTSGDRYDVHASGTADLIVRSRVGDVCIEFHERTPAEKDAGLRSMKTRLGISQLDGRNCRNNTPGDLDWIATFTSKFDRRLILTSRNSFSKRGPEPIELVPSMEAAPR